MDRVPDKSPAAADLSTPTQPTFMAALRFWFKLGLISFGGPAGQIAIMHHELVERRRWVSNARFLNALNYCMLLPGPEAQQLATYIGWLLHRIPGGVVAGALFVIPSMVVLFVLSYVYAAFGSVPWVAAIFDGLKAAIMAVVFAAVIKIGRKALQNSVMVALAASAFVAIAFLEAPFPLIILAAALIGYGGSHWYPALFDVANGRETEDGASGYAPICDDDATACHVEPSRRRSFLLLLSFFLLWSLPVAGILVFAPQQVLRDEALFFTKAAFMTFGGAYAVLAYIGQAGVGHFGWLTGAQMIDGLGLAETTPGPLIMVVQFVGFMAGWNNPGAMSPIVAGLWGSLVATYFTFLPCFFLVFLGGPYIEKFRGNRRLSAALSSIAAAVVGVILNLGVWFGRQVLLPAEGGVDGWAVGIGLAAFAALQYLKADILLVILGAALAGLGRFLLAG